MPKLNKKIQKFAKKIVNKSKKLKDSVYIKGLASLVLLFVFTLTFYNLLFWGKIYPGVLVAGVNVGGKTPQSAENILSSTVVPPEKITVKSENQTFWIELENIDADYDFKKSAEAAFNLHRTGNFFYDLGKRISSGFKEQRIGLRLDFNEKALEENISVIAGQVAVEPIEPSLTYQAGSVSADPGKEGLEIDREKLKADIGSALSSASSEAILVKTKKVDPSLSKENLEKYQKRGEGLSGKRLLVEFEDATFAYQNQEILDLLEGVSTYKEGEIESLVDAIAEEIERAPQNPVFVFEGGRVQEFAPSKDGIALKKDSLREKIIGNLRTLESTEDEVASIAAPVEKTSPEITTKEVNNLGINERLAIGDSTYRGSISSRVHNVGVASSKFNGVLVEPGEVFSFNEVLGDVSEFTGYKQAYIIKDGKTVLGDGGGVCQVSTTLFRAILKAGLPVVERRAHSYRVGYYEQDSLPGFDATIYSPITDLKFENDTPGHLLIQTIYEPSRSYLAFEIYGTDDGRIATTTNPIVTDVTPPPEDKYIDDPSLPQGQIKQIDYKAWGARARFTYTVKRAGEVTYQKTFYSNYQPWQAVYLRGTGSVN